jgi:hypothetical protein
VEQDNYLYLLATSGLTPVSCPLHIRALDPLALLDEHPGPKGGKVPSADVSPNIVKYLFLNKCVSHFVVLINFEILFRCTITPTYSQEITG